MVLLIPLMIFAQAETGQITGSVTDQSGAIVPNATVLVTSYTTGAERHVLTGNTGEFLVSNLLPANYRVKAVAEGFRAVEQDVTLYPRGQSWHQYHA